MEYSLKLKSLHIHSCDIHSYSHIHSDPLVVGGVTRKQRGPQVERKAKDYVCARAGGGEPGQ